MQAGLTSSKTEHMLYLPCHGSLHVFFRSLLFFMTQLAQAHCLTQWHSPVKFPGAAQEHPWILPTPHFKPGMRLFSWNAVFCFCGTFIIDTDTLNFCFGSFCSSAPMAVWILQLVCNKIEMGGNVIVGDQWLISNASLSCSFSVNIWWISDGDCDQKDLFIDSFTSRGRMNTWKPMKVNASHIWRPFTKFFRTSCFEVLQWFNFERSPRNPYRGVKFAPFVCFTMDLWGSKLLVAVL